MTEETLTSKDVLDALLADGYIKLAKTEECTVESLVFADEETRKGQHAETIAQIKRGASLLENYRLIRSERSAAGGRFDEETTKQIVSPVVQVSSGYIGAMQAYRSVALVIRQK